MPSAFSTLRPRAPQCRRRVRIYVRFVVGSSAQVGKLPPVYTELEINFFLLRRLLGVKTDGDGKQGKVQKLTKGEILMVNIGSTSTGGRIVATKVDQPPDHPRSLTYLS